MNDAKRTRELASEFINERFDYILCTYEGPNFIEVVGSIGGDTVTYRIYDNGTITQR